MAGSTDIIMIGAVVLGGALLWKMWPQISAGLTPQTADAASSPAPDTSAPAGPTPGTFSSTSPGALNDSPKVAAAKAKAGFGPGQPVCLQEDAACLAKAKAAGLADVAFSYPGYYRGYNVPVMGPSWYNTLPASNRPTMLTDPYYSYMTRVDPKTHQKIVTIDRFFPAGFYNTQANKRGSLVDPAVRGGS